MIATIRIPIAIGTFIRKKFVIRWGNGSNNNSGI